MIKKSVLFRFLGFVLLGIFLLILGFYLRHKTSIENVFISVPEANKTQSAKTKQIFLINPPEKSAHSSSLVDTQKGLMLVFFAGSREGHKDVKIYQSFFDAIKQEWSEPRAILNAEELSHLNHKFIKKLGNPVVFKDSQNRVHFFVVGVSLGGWATSKIYQFVFDESLEKLVFKQELQLSAFANFSHLVRTPALIYENGAFALPIYHELIDKYPLVAFFDQEGKFSHTKRLNSLKGQLQPSIVALNESQCLAFFRNYKNYENTAFMQTCSLGAKEWQEPFKSSLKNYDSSSVLSVFKDQNAKTQVLLLHNDGEKSTRSRLSLYHLKDASKGEFVRLLSLDEGEELSYPAAMIKDENLYISYTFNRQKIKIQKLDLSYLQNLLEFEGEK
ncbi:neuraminidase [Campylobacter sp. MIT 12-8780]|uniref:exo-alpha-sialidase n=1 Tax=unclassified Campylobacter TaxID=2593542 RepID=UPI00115E0369|nr:MULTISPECIES: sialidase family protein [unclassified Campylobacter]NDJ26560.1 exo-alpha-sialidase [Campylobacter sp. MIT 19-121]TQR43129.1 neuraminidase [Campylobacter sp. MIT 12-8780]